ncbi:MAG: hypothetical protein ACRDCC_10620 [Culicoidibacterales bacterium]
MKYRKKPVVIEAVRLERTKESLVRAHEFMGNYEIATRISESNDEITRACGINVETDHGDMTAYFGDYIIKGVRGELYPCKTDIFEETYEAME